MRPVLLTLIVLAGIWLAYVGLSAADPEYDAPRAVAPRELSGAVPAGYLVRRFEVAGMCCESCPKKLHDRLLHVEGVAEAAFDLEAGTAAVVVAGNVPVQTLIAELTAEPKYTVRALEP